MATPKVLIKRSSVAGRVPGTGDLDYGELAINFEDGKIYYKDASNNIKAFVDSARVQAIADAVETTAEAQLDSAEVIALIDSAYVQARQADIYRDSAFVTSIIDGDYIVAIVDQIYIQDNQITYNTSDFLDSDTVSLVVDSAYVQARQITYNTSDFLDSDTVSLVIDSAYVQARQSSVGEAGVDSAYVTGLPVSTFTNDANYLDSSTITIPVNQIVNVAYVQARQTTYNNSDFTDSAFVTGLPVSTFTNDANYLDSTTATQLIDSAYVQARQTTYDFLDSAEAIALIDSAYVRARVRTDQDLRTTDDVTFAKITGDSAALGQVSFSTTWNDSHIPFEEGAVWYDPHHKNLNYYTDFDHPIELGMQVIERVYNNNAYTILKGQPLYYSGNRTTEDGQESPTVALANATESTKYNVQGLAAEDIPQNSYGQIIVAGVIDKIDTSSLNAGENFFAGLTDGAVQNAAPTYPNYPMCLGWVIVSDSNNGKVIINQQNHSVNTFRVQGDTHIGDDLVVDGNLTVNGTQTITSTENVQIGGNIQYLNAGDTIGETGTSFVGSGLDDAFFSGHYSGDSSTKSFFVKIDSSGATDTFEWGFDSSVGTEATGIVITGNPQILDSTYGISIDFGTTTGHTTGDKWTGTATATDVDTGIFSNRNTGDGGDGYTHLGLYYDVSQNEWTFVSEYEPEPESPINRSHGSFAYGDVRGKDFYGTTFNGNLTGNVTGTVSDISNHSTTDLSEGTNLYYTTARVDSDIAASLTDSGNTVYINTTTIVESTIDSAYVLARVSEAPFLDSADAIALIDSTYVQARQITYNTSNFTDSAFVTGLPVSTFTNDANYLDSTTATQLIDSAYVQARQITYNTSDFTDSAFVTGLPVSTFTNDANYLDSTTASALIDSAYITGKIADGQLIVDGDGSTNGVTIQSGAITIRTDSSPAYVDFFCEVSNAHRTRVKSAAHADYSGNVDVTLPTTTGIIAITSDIPTFGTDYVDSAEVIKLITANAIDSGIALQLLLDSSEVVNLIDSAYINARVAAGTDSAATIALIEATVDSAYVQLRQSASGGGGTDSAAIIQLIDSAYVQLRQSQVEGVAALEQTTYYFTASAGDSSFSGADDFSNTLSYTSGKVQVYINGILQVKTSDYVANNGTSVSLVEAADSGDIIAIETITGNTANTRLNLTTYVFTADSGDTTFAGADDRGLILDYAEGRISVFLNGILLLDSDDYTASNGTSIVTNALDSGDVLTIQQFTGTNIGIDSSESRAIARTLVDSAYINARVDATVIDSIGAIGNVTSIGATEGQILKFDSATQKFILATDGGGGGGGLDSAAAVNLINDRLITHNLGDVVGADGNPGDILLSDGDGTATWSGNGALSYEFKVNYDSLGAISTVTDLPTGFTHDSTAGNTIIVSHNTGRSVKDITFNSYVSGTLKLRRPSADSADIVTYLVADRLNKFTANVSQSTTGADADQYAWVNIIF